MTADYRIALRMDDRTQWEHDKHREPLDDVVVRDVSMFRAEMMDDRNLWLACYLAGTDEHVRMWVQVKKGKLSFTCTEAPCGDGFTHEADR